MKKIISCLIIILVIFSPTFAQTKSKTTDETPPKPIVKIGSADTPVVDITQLTPETKRRLDTFRVVWQTVKDNYFDQTFNGHNWENVKAEFEPRILKSVSDKETYEILEEMINLLNRSHFAIIPPEVYKEINAERAKSRKLEKKINDAQKQNRYSSARTAAK